MAHGHPDWGPSAAGSTIYSLQDIGELAARLGSINTFDRRGNVIHLDDFECGLRGWYCAGSGNGNDQEQSSEAARNGAFCAKLTGGSSAGLSSYIRKRLPYPVMSLLGAEISFDLEFAAVDKFYLYFDLYDGVTMHHGRIRVTASTGEVAYQDDNADYIALGTNLFYPRGGSLFNTLKVVIDFDNDLYVRIIFNNVEYDVSTAALFTEASAEEAQINLTLMVISNTGNNGEAWCDDLIVTQNEP